MGGPGSGDAGWRTEVGRREVRPTLRWGGRAGWRGKKEGWAAVSGPEEGAGGWAREGGGGKMGCWQPKGGREISPFSFGVFGRILNSFV